jgi:hypothetical protein
MAAVRIDTEVAISTEAGAICARWEKLKGRRMQRVMEGKKDIGARE